MITGDKNYPDSHPDTPNECMSGSDFFLILHNDEVHTFDYVVESLVEICQHLPDQAEQCAYIAHYKGRCDIKKGNQDVLGRMLRQFTRKGLTVTLE